MSSSRIVLGGTKPKQPLDTLVPVIQSMFWGFWVWGRGWGTADFPGGAISIQKSVNTQKDTALELREIPRKQKRNTISYQSD